MNTKQYLFRKLLSSLAFMVIMVAASGLQAQDSFVKEVDGIQNSFNKKAIELQVFPNPTVDFVNISVNDLESVSNYTISNILGKYITEGIIESKLTTIDLIEQKPGIYLISFFNKNGKKINTRKVIKN